MVNLSWPFSSVRDAIRGIYLETAEAEWKGAPDSAERADDDATAADILSLNNNNGTVYIILVKQLVSNQFFFVEKTGGHAYSALKNT
jgi:frataxin-like iron-binding protein CyaY